MHRKSVLFIVILGVGLFLTSPSKTTEIAPKLLKALALNEKVNIVVDFIGGNGKAILAIEDQPFTTRGERLRILKFFLQNEAEISQTSVQDYLSSRLVPFNSFWISNQILVKNASASLVKDLADLPHVSKISEQKVFPLELQQASTKSSLVSVEEPWGISRIEAREAWKISNGTGIVVAHIDTGVHHTHETLRHNFRAEYGWLDPFFNSSMPYDNGLFNGHGTHTMGTLVGSNGIGVAPGAQWISCKGCDYACQDEELLTCGQWILCPTRADGSDADCSKAPHIASNSWGSERDDGYFESVVDAWVAGGIVPIFGSGNQGPDCGTVFNPSDLKNSISVGAINSSNVLSTFSNSGPAYDGRLKPDLVAPGENILSANPANDTAYLVLSGTSFATPHVAGVAALLLSANPTMTVAQIRQALINGCDRNVTTSNRACGGIDDSVFPNHSLGWGLTNARRSLEVAMKN